MKAILGLLILGGFFCWWLIKVSARTVKAVKDVGEQAYDDYQASKLVHKALHQQQLPTLLLSNKNFQFNGQDVTVMIGSLGELAQFTTWAKENNPGWAQHYADRGWFGPLTKLNTHLYMIVPEDIPYLPFHRHLEAIGFYSGVDTPELGVYGTDGKFYNVLLSDIDHDGFIFSSYRLRSFAR